MNVRRDALLGAARLVVAVNEIGLRNQNVGVTTVGRLDVEPNSRNTIPGAVSLDADIRAFSQDALEAMGRDMEAAARDIARDLGLDVTCTLLARKAPTVFDKGMVDLVRRSSEKLGLAHMDIVSGAGHDAIYLSAIAPTAMIFIPCENGLSHNEAESATPDDITAGTNVLLAAMLQAAGQD